MFTNLLLILLCPSIYSEFSKPSIKTAAAADSYSVSQLEYYLDSVTNAPILDCHLICARLWKIFYKEQSRGLE